MRNVGFLNNDFVLSGNKKNIQVPLKRSYELKRFLQNIKVLRIVLLCHSRTHWSSSFFHSWNQKSTTFISLFDRENFNGCNNLKSWSWNILLDISTALIRRKDGRGLCVQSPAQRKMYEKSFKQKINGKAPTCTCRWTSSSQPQRHSRTPPRPLLQGNLAHRHRPASCQGKVLLPHHQQHYWCCMRSHTLLRQGLVVVVEMGVQEVLVLLFHKEFASR